MLPALDRLIGELALEPHPEGGYYRRTYTAPWVVPRETLGEAFGGPRAVASAILYLLPRSERSCLHRLAADEMWHLYLGGPLTVVELPATAEAPPRQTQLGSDVLAGERVQHTVPAGTWFGALMAADAASPYTLLGCTVHPGFDFAEFELGRRDELAQHYQHPQAKAWIERLTP